MDRFPPGPVKKIKQNAADRMICRRFIRRSVFLIRDDPEMFQKPSGTYREKRQPKKILSVF